MIVERLLRVTQFETAVLVLAEWFYKVTGGGGFYRAEEELNGKVEQAARMFPI
jgi:hypothetical protein